MSERTSSRGWALVTGASSGLGAELARQLAARGHDVALTARRRDRLDALASELSGRYSVGTFVVEGDLGSTGAVERLVAALDARGIAPSLLVNNAGFGVHGLAVEESIARQLAMIDLNVRALTELSLVLGGRMAARGAGAILNVGSTGSFQPAPYVAAYAATKAYVLSFSSALSWELAPRGVRVLAVCPGPTRTEFFEAGNVRVAVNRLLYMSAERCAHIALRALDSGRRVVVTGWLNAIGAWVARMLPFWLILPIGARIMRPLPAPDAPASKT